MTYSTTQYYTLEDYSLVRSAHQRLVKHYRSADLDSISWYWLWELNSDNEYHQERVGPFTVHSGPLNSIPLPLVALYLDSQIKTYMDRDALGDQVRGRIDRADGEAREAITSAREAEIARRIGGGGLQGGDLQMALVEYNGCVVGGMLVNPGKSNETVAAIMRSMPGTTTSIAALQANYTLEPGDPFCETREENIVDFVRYFRTPDVVLKRMLSPHLAKRSSYRRTAHLSRALTISEAFAATERWMRHHSRSLTTCVCETPNDDVKALIEGKRFKGADGKELRVGGIPHRILTSATGVELYPAAYKNRTEGTSKLYTLYAFDFALTAQRAREYREHAIAAYRLLASPQHWAAGASR